MAGWYPSWAEWAGANSVLRINPDSFPVFPLKRGVSGRKEEWSRMNN